MLSQYTHLDTIYTLKPEYKKSYTHVIIEQGNTTREIIVTLWSNWNSSYNKVIRYPAGTKLSVIARQYRARKGRNRL